VAGVGGSLSCRRATEFDRESVVLLGHLLQVSLPRLEADLQRGLKGLESVPDSTPAPPAIPQVQASLAVECGVQIFSGVKCPVLAVFRDPQEPGPGAGSDPVKRAAVEADDLARTTAQADAFQAGNPAAHLVRLAN
jgi:non-heme chloroperoxidase